MFMCTPPRARLDHATATPFVEPAVPRYGTHHITMGQQLARADAFLASAPDVTWNTADCAGGASSIKFTLIMLDPDAPDRHGDGSKAHPKAGPWLHWLVTDATDGNVGRSCRATLDRLHLWGIIGTNISI
jgi:phosphatidylethanolamine-binding protein (PEBP) family uncharacterized protein